MVEYVFVGFMFQHDTGSAFGEGIDDSEHGALDFVALVVFDFDSPAHFVGHGEISGNLVRDGGNEVVKAISRCSNNRGHRSIPTHRRGNTVDP